MTNSYTHPIISKKRTLEKKHSKCHKWFFFKNTYQLRVIAHFKFCNVVIYGSTTLTRNQNRKEVNKQKICFGVWNTSLILALPFQVSLIGVWINKERLLEAVQTGCQHRQNVIVGQSVQHGALCQHQRHLQLGGLICNSSTPVRIPQFSCTAWQLVWHHVTFHHPYTFPHYCRRFSKCLKISISAVTLFLL